MLLKCKRYILPQIFRGKAPEFQFYRIHRFGIQYEQQIHNLLKCLAVHEAKKTYVDLAF
jgi:hypothetical protein